jgi:alpha-amylase
MDKIYLAFGVHNHQPVGNFDAVFEQVCQQCYFPYLRLLKEHPGFRSSLHFSGVLLDWILAHHPHIAGEIQELVDRNQVELLTGAYYEPILPVIPDHDKIGQIRKYTDFLHTRFGTKPRGMWLAERVWEPHLAAALNRAGIQYSVLDDTHFKYAGLTDDQLFGYYVTEGEGYTLNLLPIAKRLRYTIPFAKPSVTIDFMREIARKHPHAVVVYADDGEKFGSWPETYKSVWEEGWLSAFLAELEKHRDWLTVIPLGEVMRRVPPLGRIYLPAASYAEMSEWALPPDTGRDFEDFLHKISESGDDEKYGIFARGGMWRNFLVKYPEANQMHKRMLSISKEINHWSRRTGDNPSLVAARDHLWQGQCNCAYWHGVFGGLYLPHLRAAIWKHLIAAARIINEAHNEHQTFASVKKLDFDADGRNEVLLANDKFFACIKCSAGGSLVEYDVYDKGINLIDGLSRREEIYHRKVAEAVYKPAGEELPRDAVSIHERITAKEENLERFLRYDWYRRASFLDHFFGDSADCESFAKNDYPELGDFVNQAYTAEIGVSSPGKYAILHRRGGVWVGSEHVPVEVEKTFGAEPGSPYLHVAYRVTNCWDRPVNVRFGIEFCAALQSDNRPHTAMRFDETDQTLPLNIIGVQNSGRIWEIIDADRDLKIAVETDHPAEWWYFPLYTVSLSEDGFERSYPCNISCAVWPLELPPGGTWATVLTHYAGSRERNADISLVGKQVPGTLQSPNGGCPSLVI